MRKICLLFLHYILIFNISGQTYNLLPASISVANASVADSKYYSAFQNPANVALQTGTRAGISYESKFLLKALSQKTVHLSTSTSLLNIGLAATYSGYELHNELLSGVSLSRNFGNIFQLGIQYNYYSVYVAEANKRYAAFFPQIGLLVKVAPAINIGFATFNPGQQYIQLKYVKKQIPSIFSLGTDWKISDNLNFLFQTDRNVSGSYRIAGGFCYEMNDFICFKSGVYHADYLIPTIGFGVKLKNFGFHLNTELHPILGLTTGAAIQFSIAEK